MADGTFKEAYLEDQGRPNPIGDTIAAGLDNDYMGITAPDPDNGDIPTDVGITLAQLKAGIGSPDIIDISSTPAETTSSPTTFESLKDIVIPAGFVTPTSAFIIDAQFERLNIVEDITLQIKNTDAAQDFMNVVLNATTGDPVDTSDSFRKRMTFSMYNNLTTHTTNERGVQND